MTFNAGQTVTADLLNSALAAVTPLWALKTANETVTSSAVLQNDDQLFLSPAVSTTYDLELCIYHFVAGSIIDMNAAFTFPANATLSIGALGPDTSLGAGLTNSTGQYAAGAGDTSTPTLTISFGSGSNIFSMIKGTLVMGATTGTLQFQWCQNSSNAAGLTIYAGSYLKLTPH